MSEAGGHFVDSEIIHPMAALKPALYGDIWDKANKVHVRGPALYPVCNEQVFNAIVIVVSKQGTPAPVGCSNPVHQPYIAEGFAVAEVFLQRVQLRR